MTPQQLIIRHLDVLEQALPIAEEIGEKIMRAIDNHVAQWAKGRDGWWAQTNLEEQWCHFGPEIWPSDQETKASKAYFELGATSEDDDLYYRQYLAMMTGAVSYEFGVYFSVDAGWMTRLTGRGARPKAAWSGFLADQLNKLSTLHSAGFRQMKDGLFLPIRLVADDLAEAYPHTLEDALQPVDEVLQTLGNAYEHINVIVQAAEQHFQAL